MSLSVIEKGANRSFPQSARLHGGALALAGGRRRMRGRGFWSSLGDSFKRLGSNANDFFKRTKLISTVANIIPNPVAKGVGFLASNLGYGRFTRRVKTYSRRSGQVRKHTRRNPRKCHCGSGRGCGCR
mgnify:CR=1 FL=1